MPSGYTREGPNLVFENTGDSPAPGCSAPAAVVDFGQFLATATRLEPVVAFTHADAFCGSSERREVDHSCHRHADFGGLSHLTGTAV